MANVLGETVLGEEVVVEQALVTADAFTFGWAPELGSHPAFIHGYVYPLDSFALLSYIEGEDSAFSTDDDSWGTEAEAEAELAAVGGTNIVNFYEPKRMYTNGYITFLSSTGRKMFIVNRSNLMDVPTEDGKADLSATIVKDYGPFENDIYLYRNPTWIRGPHD